MPRGDGMGPMGGGGRGMGRGRGQAAGSNQGRGRMGGPLAAGPGGVCVCPNCGKEMPHVQGQACSVMACPNCGSSMIRG